MNIYDSSTTSSGKRKLNLFVFLFSSFCVLFNVLPCFVMDCPLVRLSNVFETQEANFVFLIFFFVIASFIFVEIFDWVRLNIIRRLKPFRPRLGEVLIARGYITHDQLKDVLREQSLRIGEVLIKGGHITPLELEHALEVQKHQPGVLIGHVLKELEYAGLREINWALERAKRKLGKIVVGRGLIAEFDLKTELGRLWYGRYNGL